MADPTVSDSLTGSSTETAKNHFARAMEEARAGAQALASDYKDKFTQAKGEWTSEAKTRSDDARDKANSFAGDAKAKATDYANEGKARTSQAIASLSKLIDDNTAVIDDKVGAKYGDYVRTASQSLKDTASKLDEKSLEELGEEAREFVRTSPGVAIGIAVATGYLFARVFRSK